MTLFALLAVFGEVGAAVGPLVGAAMLGWGFPAVAASGAVLFVLVGVVLAALLPRERGTVRLPRTSAGGRREAFAVLRDRRFAALAVLASVNLLAYNQLYFGLPAELERVGAGPGSLAMLFACVSILTISLQLPVARLARRCGEQLTLRVGYLLLSAAFAVLAVAAPMPPAGGAAALGPALMATVLLTLGHLTLGPLVLSLVPRFGPDVRMGSYYGLLATCGGLAVLIGNTALGGLFDRALVAGPSASAPWVVLALLPVASAVLVPRLIPDSSTSTHQGK